MRSYPLVIHKLCMNFRNPQNIVNVDKYNVDNFLQFIEIREKILI